MSIATELRGVSSWEDLKRVLINARVQSPRRIEAIAFDREMYQTEKEVREIYNVDAQLVMQRFAASHPDILVHAEAANLASVPELVLTIAGLQISRAA